tara:strand:- start:69 stop:278 length:210 start_codon:yes stop_codon:yes gene_type:complete
MADFSESLLRSLFLKVKDYPRFSMQEVEKFCWMAAHEHKHGVLPSEYDIREIDEDLYLELLQKFKSNSL